MIDSRISVSHHFYAVCIETDVATKQSEILSCFTKNVLVKGSLQQAGANHIHFQLQLPYNFGTETVLFLNKGDYFDNRLHYWYDFYLINGDQNNKRNYFLLYPYIKLKDFIEKCFIDKKLKKKILKPSVSETLHYIRHRGTKGLVDIQKKGFNADIIKYSAVVKEIENANKINIFGDNPLDSKIFEILSNHSLLILDPSSLKLKCSQQSLKSIEIAFDRFGNARFWLRNSQLDNITYHLPIVFTFFEQIGAVEESSFINPYTLLEDEQ